MKLILYGATECKKCDALKRDLRALGVRFEFKDANADENQAECDRLGVDKLPHVVQISTDTGDVLGEWAGAPETQRLIEQLKKQ
jgi:thioredoxin-like negative regulator of GroEL